MIEQHAQAINVTADRRRPAIEDFGRQRPWAVAGIGLLLGIAAARMLKASSSARYAQRGSGPGVAIEARPAGLGGR